MLNLMNTCIHLKNYILQTIISQLRINIFSFFKDLSTKLYLFFYMFTKNYGRIFTKYENMIFSKKLCLESFMEVSPQIISTKNQNRLVKNLIFEKPIKFCLVPEKIELRRAFIVIFSKIILLFEINSVI